MQFLQNLLADWEVFLECLLKGDIEPLIEIIKGVKYFGHEEMQKRP
jgi:hypothetical protein